MTELNKTSLFDEHLNLSAKMVDFGGWSMPIQYKNLKEEVIAVREKVGVFDVSHMGEFLVRGPEALDFVNHLLTNDIGSASDLKAIYSPLCNDQGMILDDLIVYKFSSNEIFMCVNAANKDKDIQWMQEKIKDFDCQIQDLSEMYSLLALQGPESFLVLKSILPELNDIEYYSIQQLSGDQELIEFVARTGYTGEDGFEIFASHERIAKIWKQLLAMGVAPCGLGARDVLRLEVCYPLYGNELTEQLTPLDTGLKWTVKLDKTDFIGKQALEQHQPQFRLLKLVLEKGIPRQGYSVENESGHEIGKVTSGSLSVVLNQGIALACIDKKLYQDGEKLNINIRGKKYPANVNKKPFVTGGHK